MKPLKNGYEVTGDFTLHGVTKPVSFELVGGRTAEFPEVDKAAWFSIGEATEKATKGQRPIIAALAEKLGIMAPDASQ